VPTVALIGTLDTKEAEYAFMADRIREHRVDVVLVDAGILSEPLVPPDIANTEVARAGGSTLVDLVAAGDRGAAVEAMARGAAAIVTGLFSDGKLDGVAGLGGSGGTAIATAAMRALPVGVPKLMVSTMASGNTRPYVGASDVTMMYSVVDVAGVNQISAEILTNAAGAIVGMVQATTPRLDLARPLVGASMFGVTTECVTAARERLEELGYEVLVFHQTGAGGQSMEELVAAGFIEAVLDVTTTELCDELVGGVLPAWPERLQVAGRLGVPQVVSLGALDMVNFGPRDTVPPAFTDRNLYVHNPSVTLMRTAVEECAQLGQRIATKLNHATGPTSLFVPLRGVSAIAVEGQVFHDPEADRALFDALREHLDPGVETHWLDLEINDPAFARQMADRLHELHEERNS
jgi:uncharacterized protein (UPF0261 family)